VPYVKGGTWLGIWKDSPNKELAWKFLEYATCNSDSLKAYAKEYGEYVSLKSVDEELATEAGEEVLGGQNLYEFYNKEMAKLPANCMTAYDGQINSMYLNAVKAYASNALGLEEAIQQFKDDVSNAYPNIAVK
jgi:ABC-type glycerol-3-phosphate transport system substrate-binding protein